MLFKYNNYNKKINILGGYYENKRCYRKRNIRF